jgi:epoxide hydrolase 4
VTTEETIAPGASDGPSATGATSATSAAALGGGVDAYGVVNGVRLHWVRAGDDRGPLVVLLHGFPDFWYGWRHQLPALGGAGYRVVAVDLRGYNLSGRPARVEDYARDVLADDVAALVRRLGAERAAIVGHDWGGVVAWHLATRHPEVVERLAVLNAPHPARYRRLLRRSSQWLRSWYVGFFQLPRVPEWTLRAGGHAALEAVWCAEHARPGAFGARELAAYRAAFAPPGALEAALAYYRALLRHPGHVARDRRVLPHRTLVVWGMRDRSLVAANAEGLERWVPRVRVVRVPDAAHWVMADAPEVVNAALLEHLRAEA